MDYLVLIIIIIVINSILYDYFGVLIDVVLIFNNLCGRVYNLIYNDWFRDENF